MPQNVRVETPRPELAPNSYAYETLPMVKPSGFREYDARWLFEKEINLNGVQALGQGLGTLIHELGVAPAIVTGHDFRAYSASVKYALACGLIEAGLKVIDIGLALTPMAYFAQFALDCRSVAMVTASHNENGWTGVKMGCARPLTFGPQEMSRLKDIVLNGAFQRRGGGAYEQAYGLRDAYLADVTRGRKLARRLKAVIACGNGTAGAFAPQAFEAIGCEVVPMDTELDHSFPRYNPNPEDLRMLHALAERVRAEKADLGLAFDGDGDRCGAVDGQGREIFADKIGVLLARDLAALHPAARFVVDIKSTGLFASDPVLAARGATTEYWKTGHSHMKRRVQETGALAGFEKSGHFFFNAPIGRGYDDGILTGIEIVRMLDRHPGKTLAELNAELPLTFATPTMSPHCPDDVKYEVVARVLARFEAMQRNGEAVAGARIVKLDTVNGVRVSLADGNWGLVRASSNKPELVVVIESPVSEARMREVFAAVDTVLRQNPEVGAYNQAI
jgi:phosphomannomutase / phosphoglucomutase